MPRTAFPGEQRRRCQQGGLQSRCRPRSGQDLASGVQKALPGLLQTKNSGCFLPQSQDCVQCSPPASLRTAPRCRLVPPPSPGPGQPVMGWDRLHLSPKACSSGYLTSRLFPPPEFSLAEPPALRAIRWYLWPRGQEHLHVRLCQKSKDSFAVKSRDGERRSG